MDALNFGSSRFKNRQDALVEVERFVVQLVSLLRKNALIFLRRPLWLIAYLLLPSFFFFPFLMEKNLKSTSSNTNFPTESLNKLGECKVYSLDDCVRVVYAPLSIKTNGVMETLRNQQGLDTSSILGFSTYKEAQQFVMGNLGKVQYSVFFRNESLYFPSYYWNAHHDYYNNTAETAVSSNLTYTIFYNASEPDNDIRSKARGGGVNVPLLSFQKSLEESYYRYTHPDEFDSYNVAYNEFWQVKPNEALIVNASLANCNLQTYDRKNNIIDVIVWVMFLCFLLQSSISFALISEERVKNLFGSLRRLGLLDTAYWTSWFVTCQILLLISACIALIVSRILSTTSSMLQNISPSVMFVTIWLSGVSDK